MVVKQLIREFIYLPSFEKQSKDIGLNDNDRMEIENAILTNPAIGVVVKGTGGIRKFRIALPNVGKSGGARIVYVDFAYYEKTYLIAVFAKSVKENLSQEECNELKKLSKILESEAEKRF